LPIPERELIENNNKVAPIQTPKTTDDKPKNEKSKDDEEKELQTPTLLYANRILKIKEDVKYLSPDDKTRFEKIALEKHIVTAEKEAEIKQFEGKINSKKKLLKSIDDTIKDVKDPEHREIFIAKQAAAQTPEDIKNLEIACNKYKELSSAEELGLTPEEQDGKIKKFPTPLEQQKSLVAALNEGKRIKLTDFNPITKKTKDAEIAEYYLKKNLNDKENAFKEANPPKKAIDWFDNDYEATGITNFQKHTPEEKEIATQNVQNFFEQKRVQQPGYPRAKNIGYVKGELKFGDMPLTLNESIQTSVSESELKSNPELKKIFDTNIFDAQQVSGNNYLPLERIDDPNKTNPSFLPPVSDYRDARHDSEYLMLTRLALDIEKQTRLGIKKGGVYKEITGHITIVSSNNICPSCQLVIRQYSKMFPRIKITIIDKIPADKNNPFKE
jgi:hypothetical protein